MSTKAWAFCAGVFTLNAVSFYLGEWWEITFLGVVGLAVIIGSILDLISYMNRRASKTKTSL